ncbi:MAG: hypothetical protein ABIJ17_01855 [Patescibacteria group bacterium]
MPNIPTTSWNETTPPGSEAKANGDNRIRELKTQIREVVDVEHKFDSSGQSTEMGIHTKGSARAYYQSADPINRPDGTSVLDSNDDGRIFVDSDDNTIKVWNGASFDNIIIDLVNGVTPGTATADKALIVDSNNDIDLGTGDITATDGNFTNLDVTTGLTLPNDSIGEDDIDWGTGAGQISLDDIPDGATKKSVESVVKIGSYEGTGSDVAITGLGFRPKLVEIFTIDRANNATMWTHDDIDPASHWHGPNGSAGVNYNIQIDADGFTAKGATIKTNAETFLYKCWSY